MYIYLYSKRRDRNGERVSERVSDWRRKQLKSIPFEYFRKKKRGLLMFIIIVWRMREVKTRLEKVKIKRANELVIYETKR